MSEEQGEGFSRQAWKRLEQTKSTRAGWGQAHYERLLMSFGFLSRQGRKHTIYWDPDDKANRVSVPRHGDLKAYVAEQVIAAVETMLKRKGIQ